MSSSSSTEGSDRSDMDYQPGVDEEVDDLANNAFIESLLAEHMAGEEEEGKTL